MSHTEMSIIEQQTPPAVADDGMTMAICGSNTKTITLPVRQFNPAATNQF